MWIILRCTKRIIVCNYYIQELSGSLRLFPYSMFKNQGFYHKLMNLNGNLTVFPFTISSRQTYGFVYFNHNVNLSWKLFKIKYDGLRSMFIHVLLWFYNHKTKTWDRKLNYFLIQISIMYNIIILCCFE